MRFEKWQGLGNDFILCEVAVSREEARALCDRRRGIGADGVLVVDASVPSMVVLNADGSRPEMCGNGLRCVAGWLAARGSAGTLVVKTDAGERRCDVVSESGTTFDVRADMGQATLTGDLTFDGRRFMLVDVGNPHAVCFDVLDAGEAERIGPALEAHVPGGVNVELARLRSDGGFDVRVFERGVGWTDACGTGACAVAAAAVERGLCERNLRVAVHLPGGPLAIEVTANTVFMQGPAARVFVGEVSGSLKGSL